MLNIQCVDPSGHTRILKFNQFPITLGTQLLERMHLRDPKLAPQAVEITQINPDDESSDLSIRVVQEDLDIELGDLKVQSLKIPLLAPLKIGDTELIFSKSDFAVAPIEFPRGERIWHTESEVGKSLLRSLQRGAQTKLSLYLFGETGTGKEVLAKLAHSWSERASGAFVPINCGALPVGLAESELFGHVKGSFTGAVRDRPGAFLQAHGGTLFLDEVGDLPMEIQVKLLRFLEDGEIRPVGSDRVLNSDVRIICATHKPLAKLVKEGTFRQDLYFRLASIPIEIPTLRSRPEDIEALATLFARELGKALSKQALLCLKAYPWPGNVRELRHAIERASGIAGPDEVLLQTKDLEFLTTKKLEEGESLTSENTTAAMPGVFKLKEMERIMVLRALKLSRGNRSDAAKILGIARSTLFEMLKRYNIVGPKATHSWTQNWSYSESVIHRI